MTRVARIAAKFVGTTIEGSNFEVAITKAFAVCSTVPVAELWQLTVHDKSCAVQRLFKYISGDNVDNKKISMTTPVITFIKPDEEFKTAEQNYTVAFYLPEQFQVG